MINNMLNKAHSGLRFGLVQLATTAKVKINVGQTSTSKILFSTTPSFKQKHKHPPEKIAEMPEQQFPIASPSDKRVYVWGLAEHGALGNQQKRRSVKKLQNYKHKPIRLHFAEQHKVTDITCGYGFTAFAVNTKDKYKVFGCGINTDSQIGYQAPRMDHPLELVLAPAPVELLFEEPDTTKVKQLSAGRAHLCVLTNNEGVFLLGNNAYGQCGRRVIENEKYMGSQSVNNIRNMDGVAIKGVECGQDHTMFLTEKGEVFSCGWSADGQTGLGHYDSVSTPGKVMGDIQGENIVKLSCTADCVLALSDKGDVFGWGNTEYSQLPIMGDNQQINVALHLKECAKLGKIKDIASGGSFCCVLTESGNVFVWGFGILGRGPKVDRSDHPVQIPPTLFGCNEFSPNTRVISIAAGLSNLAAVTQHGDLYMWGRNRGGCLGLGHVNDQFFPLRVAVGAIVKKVSLGVDHTAVLCNPYV